MGKSAGSFSIEVTGLEEVRAAMINVNKVIRKTAVKSVAAAGGRIKTNAKARAPRRSGKLAKSIRRKATNKGLGQRVYSDDPNSVFQEFGTVKMSANPFMFPALEEERARMPTEMRQSMIVALEKKQAEDRRERDDGAS